MALVRHSLCDTDSLAEQFERAYLDREALAKNADLCYEETKKEKYDWDFAARQMRDFILKHIK
jgi:phage pi2 protein 07